MFGSVMVLLLVQFDKMVKIDKLCRIISSNSRAVLTSSFVYPNINRNAVSIEGKAEFQKYIFFYHSVGSLTSGWEILYFGNEANELSAFL